MTADPDDLPPDPPPKSALCVALREGNIERVRALIAAGEDVHYRRPGGYDALIDACGGRDLTRDSRLLDLLALLVGHGVALSGVVTAHDESALQGLSANGRFDAVQFLIDAGADERLLKWTPLIQAVALGSLSDVQAALDAEADLEARDEYSRTAWHVALSLGDIAKAELLLAHGADRTACGPYGESPIQLAVESRRPTAVRCLLGLGLPADQPDQIGITPLGLAVADDERECVELLLAAGASIATAEGDFPLLGSAKSADVIRRLLAVGADPADLGTRGHRLLIGLSDVPLDALWSDEFVADFPRRFGTVNSERMDVPFWESMVRSGEWADRARRRTTAEPTRPVWCANRFGQSLTLLPDGRAVQIGGEHEDFYDPDFCIYNDVFVHGPDGSLAIYGYPEEAFPPTDFHTATLVGEFIYVIGSLGYAWARRPDETPVYRLHVGTWRMERVAAGGDVPGWISRHRAEAVPGGVRVWGEFGAFVLDLDARTWRREP